MSTAARRPTSARAPPASPSLPKSPNREACGFGRQARRMAQDQGQPNALPRAREEPSWGYRASHAS
eukprot:15456708-Alexandrium_andersonii.AAC.1